MMCELDLEKVQCVTVKYFISKIVRVWHFADGPLGQRIEINVFCTERRKACFLHHYERKEASFV